jgi:hypothetical protein
MQVPNPDRETDPDAPKTRVVKRPKPGCLTQDQLATWPDSIRPEDYYLGQKPIPAGNRPENRRKQAGTRQVLSN